MSIPAAFLLALALPAAAARWQDCAREGKPPKDRAFLQDVLDCQEKARAAFREKKLAKGLEPAPAELDALDEHQRAEVRAYLARNQSAETAAEVPQSQPHDDGSRAKSGKLGGLSDKDLNRLTPEQAGGMRDLQKRIQEQAGDGRSGITPQSAKDIEDYLLRQQGHISPEMDELLRGVAKDGGKLTHGTMKRLSDAAKAAKGEGLDLNIDQKTEKGLLEFKPDPKDDPGSAPQAPPSPGNL